MPNRFSGMGVKIANSGKDPMGSFLAFESKDPNKYIDPNKNGRPVFGSIAYLTVKAEQNKNKWALGATKMTSSVGASKSVPEITKQKWQ